MMTTNSPFTIIVAVDTVETSNRAINHAFDLASKLNIPYQLIVLHAIALNPTQSIPFLDNLDKASNIEIKQTAKQTLADLQEYVSQYDGKVNYEIKTVEGEGYPGPIIEEYILNNYPNLNLLITGTRNHQGLKKLMLGSTSEYFVHRLPCPVTIVKQSD